MSSLADPEIPAEFFESSYTFVYHDKEEDTSDTFTFLRDGVNTCYLAHRGLSDPGLDNDLLRYDGTYTISGTSITATFTKRHKSTSQPSWEGFGQWEHTDVEERVELIVLQQPLEERLAENEKWTQTAPKDKAAMKFFVGFTNLDDVFPLASKQLFVQTEMLKNDWGLGCSDL
uniref:Uncharacterized protein n=1 Tax=Chromera velia CCMP2878 TaxID=1169474 RepID=A0A0G4GB12_9ALVE|eukprot:Cvel_4457.t1-p1 / transcript=Cvel_4457.t1 / gene=Cvel_4457 / organism=Chromera_velia_CCMP2878 / gene_product=hypothetical protein / transcript_product=hypothetical protein / location=Cvel_scaffold194:105647-106162(-) / protein_length=172 / sequence_SO=supercontig / SO=protein_coding / is_pseudo=false